MTKRDPVLADGYSEMRSIGLGPELCWPRKLPEELMHWLNLNKSGFGLDNGPCCGQ